ncbi:MAG: branched-chain-amino-acid transaminase [Acidobacteria bacterium]|nr:branched-chain-amino-acid transaminase [Acidobacteriota bacterium]
MMTLWMDGHLAGGEGVSPLAHGLHYGTGVFEGIRVYPTAEGPAIFRLEDHLQRMDRGAKSLGMVLDLNLIHRGCLEAVAASGLEAAYLRPLAFYEGGGLGLDVAELKVRLLVAAMPWKNHLGEGELGGISVRTSPFQRVSGEAIPPLKLCGIYVNSVIAKLEATRAGFDEALFVDEKGMAVECTGENIFFVKDGRVIAAESPHALPGITRETVMALSGAESRPVSLEELHDADEVFVTGTSAEVTPVRRLDARDLDVGPFTLAIRNAYLDAVHGRAETHRSWLTPAFQVWV